MSTRSNIIAKLSDGTWKRIYCHLDGYLEHNGRILATHWTAQEKVEALMALGDISSLGEVIGEKHSFDYYQDFLNRYHGDYDKMCLDPEFQPLNRMVRAYRRDRGETIALGVTGATLKSVWPSKDCGTEYAYVFEDGNWRYARLPGTPRRLTDLRAALAALSAEEVA